MHEIFFCIVWTWQWGHWMCLFKSEFEFLLKHRTSIYRSVPKRKVTCCCSIELYWTQVLIWVGIWFEEHFTRCKNMKRLDKFGSLNFDRVFKTALPGKLKTCVFYQFCGIKTRIYDACEIWNCRDKNRFCGYLDTRTKRSIWFLSL